MNVPGAATAAALGRRAKPFADWRAWWLGVRPKLRIIVASAFTVWIVSNGLEASVKGATHAGWLVAAVEGMGMSWKASVIQTVLHSAWSGAVHIVGLNRTAES